MTQTRQNRSAPPGGSRAAKRYKSAHWGIEHTRTTKLVIPGIGADEAVTEMGRLIELRVKPTKSSPTYHIKFDEPGGTKPCILVFTPDVRERLFFYLPAGYRRVIAEELIHPKEPWHKLCDVAKSVGGRQVKWYFPEVQVQILGDCTHVIYDTEKEGDGESEYIHRFGDREEGDGTRPVLCIDAHGQLWLAGAGYSVPDAGITG